MKFNKVAVSGVHGAGKSTLLQALKKTNEFKHYHFYDSTSAAAAAVGCKVNLDSDNISQIKIFEKHIDRLTDNQYDNVFFDRSILDSVAYAAVSYSNGLIDKSVIQIGEECLKRTLPLYDCIIYLPPEFDIIDNGIRDTDVEYRLQVEKKFLEYMSALDCSNIISVTGSVEERVKQIIKASKI